MTALTKHEQAVQETPFHASDHPLRAPLPAPRLFYRDLVEMMAKQGFSVAHTTSLRWVQHILARQRTCVRIRGWWTCLYRAVDAAGKTVDFRLSPQRKLASANAFFWKSRRFSRPLAIDHHTGRSGGFPPCRSRTSTARQAYRFHDASRRLRVSPLHFDGFSADGTKSTGRPHTPRRQKRMIDIPCWVRLS